MGLLQSLEALHLQPPPVFEDLTDHPSHQQTCCHQGEMAPSSLLIWVQYLPIHRRVIGHPLQVQLRTLRRYYPIRHHNLILLKVPHHNIIAARSHQRIVIGHPSIQIRHQRMTHIHLRVAPKLPRNSPVRPMLLELPQLHRAHLRIDRDRLRIPLYRDQLHEAHRERHLGEDQEAILRGANHQRRGREINLLRVASRLLLEIILQWVMIPDVLQ